METFFSSILEKLNYFFHWGWYCVKVNERNTFYFNEGIGTRNSDIFLCILFRSVLWLKNRKQAFIMDSCKWGKQGCVCWVVLSEPHVFLIKGGYHRNKRNFVLLYFRSKRISHWLYLCLSFIQNGLLWLLPQTLHYHSVNYSCIFLHKGIQIL